MFKSYSGPLFQCWYGNLNIRDGYVWSVVFYVPSTARSFGDGTPIYCPLRRTWSSVFTPFPPRIEPRAVDFMYYKIQELPYLYDKCHVYHVQHKYILREYVLWIFHIYYSKIILTCPFNNTVIGTAIRWYKIMKQEKFKRTISHIPLSNDHMSVSVYQLISTCFVY